MDTAPNTRIRTDLDLDADGKQVGYVRLPLAVHTDPETMSDTISRPYPWSPFASARAPAVLLMAGNTIA